MKVLIVIPARYASTRFPGKPLTLIAGKPMIQHVYEKAVAATLNKEVLVATDDERIQQAVTGFGGNVIMTSVDHASGTDRCAEAVSLSGVEADVVVNLQGDEPFLRPEALEELVKVFENDQVQIASLCKALDSSDEASNPNIVKVVRSMSGSALYFSRAAIPYKRYPSDDTAVLKHIGLYAYRPEVLQAIAKLPPGSLELAESLEQLRWLENDYRIHMVETTYESKGIDTPEDLLNI